MLLAGLSAIVLLVASTMIHYEALRALSYTLPRLSMPPRIKVVVVILGAFAAHSIEMMMYAVTIYWLAWHHGSGTLGDTDQPSLMTCVYFASTTYTSLGYGDVVPTGALKLFAGSMALTGLLLIGWTAAYVFIAMERLWEGTGRKTNP
ncbi:MAG: potassium channel family protein [Rubrivivax sp.]